MNFSPCLENEMGEKEKGKKGEEDGKREKKGDFLEEEMKRKGSFLGMFSILFLS